LRLSQNNNSWQAVSIGSDLPSTAALSGAIGADPSLRGLLYLGDTHGLWEGLPDGMGSYHWTLNTDVPDTWVTGVVPHRNSNGFSGTLRVATYGRGIWERLVLASRCLSITCLHKPFRIDPC